jgi:serine/threonine-protein kinase
VAEVLNLLLEKSPANRPADAIKAAQMLQAVLGESRDLESLLDEAFRGDSSVRRYRDANTWKLSVKLAGGRTQVVSIEPSAHAAADRLLIIWSICCVARPGYYEQALRLNAEMPHGSVAIREIDSQARFVVIDTYPRATVDAEEVRRSVHEVACRADAIEKLLTGLDHQ